MATMDEATLPEDVFLAETHEYVRCDEDRARIGITQHAVDQLGDIVFVELPELGQVIEKGDTFGSIESVKAASDLYMPVSGEIVAINTALTSEPQLVNDDCFGDGWMIEIVLTKPEETEQLMKPEQYTRFVSETATA